MKRIGIVGGAGRMGQVMAEGLSAAPDLTVVALVDVHEPHELFGAVYAPSLEDLKDSTLDVVVDFSVPESVVHSANWCAEHGVALVIGTTGLSEAQRAEVEGAGQRVGVVMTSNFAIGAVLAERFAAQAAPHFERVEIIEMHHDRNFDAPSGTSIAAAHAIAQARAAAGREPMQDSTTRPALEGARGADAPGGVRIHSVRLPGLVAHQVVLFGGPGEGLTIRHDSYDRQSFVPGVAAAVRAIDATPRFLESISSLVE
jgi:4-hydroxy-tetrahydrodipicolinate reductase